MALTAIERILVEWPVQACRTPGNFSGYQGVLEPLMQIRAEKADRYEALHRA